VTSGSGESRARPGSSRYEARSSGLSRSAPARSQTSHAPAEPRTSTTTVVPGEQPTRRPVTVGTAAAARRGRRARLTVKRIDPWTTLKFSFVYGVAGMVVLVVAVVVLYGVVDAMGVIGSLRSFLGDVSDNSNGTGGGGGLANWLNFDRVLLLSFVIGLVNVVLFTAFATLTAFIYNVCTDIVGGVEVTLAERN
jgi:hypothetical protein